MNKISIKWNFKLKNNIFEVVRSDCGRLLAIVHENLKTLSIFSVEAKEVIFTHVFGGSIIKEIYFFGDWIFVLYWGGKSGWMKFSLDGNTVEKIKSLSRMDRFVYRSKDYAAFSRDSDESCVLFNFVKGEFEDFDASKAMLGVVGGGGGHFYAWVERDGNYQIAIGTIEAKSGVPLRKSINVFSPHGQGSDGYSRVVDSTESNFLYALDNSLNKFGWYAWDGLEQSVFQAPMSISSYFRNIKNKIYKNNNKLYSYHTFSNYDKNEVIICNFDLNSGELIWQSKIHSPLNGCNFSITGGYLIHALGAQGCKGPLEDGKLYFQDESRQIDLATGEVGNFLDEPIGHWLCSSGNGMFFSLLSKGRSWLTYGEF